MLTRLRHRDSNAEQPQVSSLLYCPNALPAHLSVVICETCNIYNTPPFFLKTIAAITLSAHQTVERFTSAIRRGNFIIRD
jgi:hypothetical protein